MNLKAFHVLFITAATLLACGLGVWCLREYSADGGSGMVAGAVVSFAAAAGLVGYGMWFLRKVKGL